MISSASFAIRNPAGPLWSPVSVNSTTCSALGDLRDLGDAGERGAGEALCEQGLQVKDVRILASKDERNIGAERGEGRGERKGDCNDD